MPYKNGICGTVKIQTHKPILAHSVIRLQGIEKRKDDLEVPDSQEWGIMGNRFKNKWSYRSFAFGREVAGYGFYRQNRKEYSKDSRETAERLSYRRRKYDSSDG
ncbi:MAG TPA: hypothetical protein IAB31_10600 [Candidatus Choladousia intestinavium]|uniref:Uncharacterized protein n=1 Tax=Candidatus Choladousia intestinavium TaxID=2840727 RepID=A0A9D1D9Y3_9FIRM|nr:hypothetical protein [Candidatus Choladousia intestinavium]